MPNSCNSSLFFKRIGDFTPFNRILGVATSYRYIHIYIYIQWMKHLVYTGWWLQKISRSSVMDSYGTSKAPRSRMCKARWCAPNSGRSASFARSGRKSGFQWQLPIRNRGLNAQPPYKIYGNIRENRRNVWNITTPTNRGFRAGEIIKLNLMIFQPKPCLISGGYFSRLFVCSLDLLNTYCIFSWPFFFPPSKATSGFPHGFDGMVQYFSLFFPIVCLGTCVVLVKPC